MSDTLSWMLEKYSCDVRISQLNMDLPKWEAEEESLSRFRQAVRNTQDELSDNTSNAVQAMQDLTGMAETCLTAGRFGQAMEEELESVGQGMAGAALHRLEERIERELQNYQRKQEEGRRELTQAKARREQLDAWIREAENEEP